MSSADYLKRKIIREDSTILMSLKTGALTTVGFRAWEIVCHTDVRMNKADGMMEKNSCSKGTLKSNCSRLSFNNASPPIVKGILIAQARCMLSIQTGHVEYGQGMHV